MNTKEESQSKAAKQFESSTLENISKQIPPFKLDQNASSNILGGAPDTLESFIPIQRITSVAYPQERFIILSVFLYLINYRDNTQYEAILTK